MEAEKASELTITRDRRNIEEHLKWDFSYSFVYRNPFNGSKRLAKREYKKISASELRQILKKHEDKENTATTFGFQKDFSPKAITQHQYRFNGKLEDSLHVQYPLAYLNRFMREPRTDHDQTDFRNSNQTPRQGRKFLDPAYLKLAF